MNSSKNQSAQFKLSINLFNGIRFSTLYSHSNDSWQGYDHSFKYNPDGRSTDHKVTNYIFFQLNQMFSQKLFYELKYSVVDNDYGSYVYEDPLIVDMFTIVILIVMDLDF